MLGVQRWGRGQIWPFYFGTWVSTVRWINLACVHRERLPEGIIKLDIWGRRTVRCGEPMASPGKWSTFMLGSPHRTVSSQEGNHPKNLSLKKGCEWAHGNLWAWAETPEGEDSSSPLFPTMMVINRGFLAKTSTFDTPQHRTQFNVSLGIAIQNIGYSIFVYT